MSLELSAETHRQVTALSHQGDALAQQGQYEEAIASYERGWALLPEPKLQWEAATWLLAAIADAHFLAQRFEACLAAVTRAITEGPGGLGNPFLHLRRGEALFELNRRKEAADELMRAWMGAGADIFKAEDPKYLEYLKTVAKL